MPVHPKEAPIVTWYIERIVSPNCRCVVKRFHSVSSMILLAAAVTGCNSSIDVKTDSESGLTYNSSTRNGTDSVDKSSWTGPDGKMNSITNEKKVSNGESTRISVRNINGVESRLEAHGDVVFLKGLVSKLPSGAKVTIFEKSNGVAREGELRVEGTQIRVWMKTGKSFEPGTANDQAWADKLLASFGWDDTPDPQKKKELATLRLDDPQFAKKLVTLHYSKDIAEVLTEKAKSPALSAKEQVSLIDLVLEKVHYDKDKKAVLLELIHRKDLAKEASMHLLDNLEKINYEADRKQIQRELFERASAR